jgi:hypothetical protein
MNRTIGLQLVVYSLLLAGLSYLTHHLAPALARPTLIAGLAGGGLCLAWGFRAVAGSRSKALPVLTLIPVSFVLLSQTVMGWTGGSQEAPGRRVAGVVITVLFVLSIAMLMRIAYAGAFGPGQTGAARNATGGSTPNKGKPANPSGKAQRV